MLVADLEHLPRTSYQPLPHDDDRQTGEEHAEGLEHIRPDDRLDASERSVEYTDTEGDEDGQVRVGVAQDDPSSLRLDPQRRFSPLGSAMENSDWTSKYTRPGDGPRIEASQPQALCHQESF